MYSLSELKKQNQEISDLIEVLRVLISNEKLVNNPFVCGLVSRFNEKVWMHLVFEDNSLYSELAKNHNPDISDIAQRFHDSAKEIKKEFSCYVKLWCKTSGVDHDQQAFCGNSLDMLDKIQQRIEFESNKIFPLVESQTTA
ncbi:MAG: hemerythrin domain-containing protein [Gammaproteobacteria bacterium]|nr:hemerythrin domain-containing protein [Gammaproteobacteria bacterium]